MWDDDNPDTSCSISTNMEECLLFIDAFPLQQLRKYHTESEINTTPAGRKCQCQLLPSHEAFWRDVESCLDYKNYEIVNECGEIVCFVC